MYYILTIPLDSQKRTAKTCIHCKVKKGPSGYYKDKFYNTNVCKECVKKQIEVRKKLGNVK